MQDYKQIQDMSRRAWDFLEKEAATAATGRHDLGGGMYANVEEYSSRESSAGKFENHKKYIDIQYIISGREQIFTAPVAGLERLEEYDAARDIEFFRNNEKGEAHYLQAGDSLLIRPGEAHMPGICLDKPETVRKCVVKIPVN